MRFFIAKNGSTVVDKQVLAGDNDKIDILVSDYVLKHPLLTVQETDEATFDATVILPVQTQAQKDWATLKASSPTALQIAVFFAKYLGLE